MDFDANQGKPTRAIDALAHFAALVLVQPSSKARLCEGWLSPSARHSNTLISQEHCKLLARPCDDARRIRKTPGTSAYPSGRKQEDDKRRKRLQAYSLKYVRGFIVRECLRASQGNCSADLTTRRKFGERRDPPLRR